MSSFELVFPGGRPLGQRDLEAMDRESLLAVRNAATELFNEDIDGETAGYYEMLAGAADEAFLARFAAEKESSHPAERFLMRMHELTHEVSGVADRLRALLNRHAGEVVEGEAAESWIIDLVNAARDEDDELQRIGGEMAVAAAKLFTPSKEPPTMDEIREEVTS